MKYTIQKKVTIRKEPRIVNWPNNAKGTLAVGDTREVLETVTQSDQSTWGRVSDYDASGKALWFCINNLNSRFAVPTPDPIEINYPAEVKGNKIELVINGKTVFSITL